jgi:hypothetical protein
MQTPYIEKDCTIEHNGQTFEASGSVVTDDRIVAYLGADNVLTDWHGKALGKYRITSTWGINSALSSTMSQVEATVNGVKYTGRSMGLGMVYNGKRKK